jgi:hypothetical protein
LKRRRSDDTAGDCNDVRLPAAITATLLVIDAWFDVTTSAPGSAATEAIAMAVFPELPMAGLCVLLAMLNAPGRQQARTNDRPS